jgi:hypothetical protein
MTSINNNTKAYFFLAIVALVYFFPIFIDGQNTLFKIVDNLDCYYVWNKVAAQHQYAWAAPDTIIQEYMNGLPKFTLVNNYSLFFILNIIFSSFYAASIHMVLIHTIGCFAMYAFAVKHLTRGNIVAAIIAAVVFGFREYTYAFGLSISLLPILVLVFINFVRKEESIKDWLFIFIYPFLSNFQSVGVFILSFWFLFAVIYGIKKHRLFFKLFAGLILMAGLYYINNYPTINNLLFDHYFVSHRKAFVLSGVSHLMKNTIITDESQNLAYYAKHIFGRKIFILCGVVLFAMYRSNHRHFKLLLGITLAMVFFQLRDFLLNLEMLRYVQEKIMLFRMFHFYKLFVFEVFFQAMAYAIMATYFFSIFNYKWIAYAILIILFPFAIRLSLLWEPILGKPWQKDARPFLAYYSPDLFKKIKESIPLPVDKYKVASFGLDPAIASYNGLYTVDGYINNYPLEYRNRFKEVIADDLKLINDKFGHNEFETRGHFCYLQNTGWIEYGDLQIPTDKLNPMPSPQKVHWNYEALKNLGCSFIISTTKIINDNNNLLKLDVFENNQYKLYLYKIL